MSTSTWLTDEPTPTPVATGSARKRRATVRANPIEAYLAFKRNHENRQPHTIRSYANTLKLWSEWRSGDVLGATYDEACEWLDRPRTRRAHGKPAAPATRRREVVTLQGFYEWCVQEELLAKNPMARLVRPTIRKRKPRPVPLPIWREVWNAELTDSERLVLGLGFFVGLRREEMMRLRCGDITRHDIRDFIRKGGGEDTTPWRLMVEAIAELGIEAVGDPAPFVAIMERASRHDRPMDFLIPWVTSSTQTANAINKRMVRLFDRLDVADADQFTPHQLRHSCATLLCQAQVPLEDVSVLLNHSDVSITMAYVEAGASGLRRHLDRTRQARGR